MKRQLTSGSLSVLLIALACVGPAPAAEVTIIGVEPTPLFPKPESGSPLKQVVRLYLDNPGGVFEGRARVRLNDQPASIEDLGQVAPGRSTNRIGIVDLTATAELMVEILDAATGQVLAHWQQRWEPQKKWKIHCISYSHHDLGFGNYPHRLRTEIRHANIERPLQYCAETDAWDEDSKFRFVIETSEPMTSFLGSHSPAEAQALARRIREGRIQVGGLLATVNTEQLGHELMARLFYLSGRHTPDLLGVPRGRTALINDVIGLTWPFASALNEARQAYLFHGYNGCGHCLKPAEYEPVFYWHGPDRDPEAKVLVRSVAYGGYAGDSLGDGSADTITRAIEKLGKDWPYDTLLLQEGTDFQLVTRDPADKIRSWNQRYEHPHLVCATLDMFFDAIAAQAKQKEVKTFAKDANNQWADQDANDAWLLGHARKLGEAIPATEKLATITTVLQGGAYPWTELYQAYHRLLLYHEHTDAIDYIAPQAERMRQYETELIENREMVIEAQEFCRDAREGSLRKLAALVTTAELRNLVVFNSLAQPRTDVVRFRPAAGADGFRIVDPEDGRAVACQGLPDGTSVFIARDVPGIGYKTYSLLPGEPVIRGREIREPLMENAFYRIRLDPRRGSISSLYDKRLERELVDHSAPHQFNEYLYERIERKGGAVTSVWHRVESAKVSQVNGPVAQVLTIDSSPTGVERMTQTVVLYHDLNRIDFGIDMTKAPSGRKSRQSNQDLVNKESVYVAMPFAVPDYRFIHELPGGVAEPIRDQFDGSCTAFYAVRHFTDVSNERYGVTVSPVEMSLVQYGRPRSSPIVGGREHEFERDMTYPANSRMYLYLLNNMFDVNVRWDQPGPVQFSWSMRSHAGNWQQGRADEFGWAVHNPLSAHWVEGRKRGRWPATASFLTIDASHVVATTLKPAEANGDGYILRVHETRGQASDVTVRMPFLRRLASARETDLVEEDLDGIGPTVDQDRVRFAIRPFETKTIRVAGADEKSAGAVTGMSARAVSDMQVHLEWTPTSGGSYYRVYRGEQPDFKPSLLALVGRTAAPAFLDQPVLHYGGWINNRLQPETTYYYRVAAVDRANREGPVSAARMVKTLASAQANMPPQKVEALRAVLVSPLAPFNFVNLLFRTSCEADVDTYEVHRSTRQGFQPGEATRIGRVDAKSIIKGSSAYGHVPIDYPAGAYDHLMYEDQTVAAETDYFYRVRALDRAGQTGPFSEEAFVRTGAAPPPTLAIGARASSVYAPEYGATRAIDGSEDPSAAWISKPYGGGSLGNPSEAWLELDFPDALTLQGLTIVGDHRDVIPVQPGLQVDVRTAFGWVTKNTVAGNTQRDLRFLWDKPEAVSGVRLRVVPELLPKSERPDIPDGVVRIVEVLGVLPDGVELPLAEIPAP